MFKIDEEFLEEIKGVAEGARTVGVNITWQEVLVWNGYCELTDYWWPNEKEGKFANGDQTDEDYCSSFIATGSATRDGKMMDSDLASDLSFWARWGSSSDMPFDAEEFLAEHIQWSHLEGSLKDRLTQPWALFKAGQAR